MLGSIMRNNNKQFSCKSQNKPVSNGVESAEPVGLLSFKISLKEIVKDEIERKSLFEVLIKGPFWEHFIAQ